jgi:hypothetical protein
VIDSRSLAEFLERKATLPHGLLKLLNQVRLRNAFGHVGALRYVFVE